MTLTKFDVLNEAPLEGGVVVEFFDETARRTAHVQREALDDIFDHLNGLRPKEHGLSNATYVKLAKDNLAAFARIVSAVYERSGRPAAQLEIRGSDIQGEKFTRDALLDAGLASPRTGTQRRATR